MSQKIHKSAKDKREAPSPQEQSARFKKIARDLGCDETPGALDRAFGKIAPKRGGQRND